jgi:hypothetical protein
VSEHRLSDDTLRQAFQAVKVPAADACTPDDLDRIWRALGGELPAAERRRLVERLSTEPALAEAWRGVHHLQHRVPAATATSPRPRMSSWWRASRVAAAAALVLAAVTVMVLRRDGAGGDTLRSGGTHAIESLLSDEADLPRDAFRLHWSPGPQDSRYHVRVTTEDLQLIAAVADLAEPELVIDRATLASVPSGARVLWHVETLLPGGERVSSLTFVVRVRPGS